MGIEAENSGFCVYGDELYPKQFYGLDDPPPKIFYYGDITLADRKSIAMVGTRDCSLYGEHSTKTLVEVLASYQMPIVSGLARGIDYAALDTAFNLGLPVIAVIGSGLEKFNYGGKQKNLFNKIRSNPLGLIISEQEPCHQALARNFAMRNRLIAALADATVVIEAPAESGSLITSYHASRLGRRVYCLPGDLGKGSFIGSNKLIAEGKAELIYSLENFPQQLGLKVQETKALLARGFQLSLFKQQILEILQAQPLSFDVLVTQVRISHQELSRELGQLEVSGLINKNKGVYVRAAHLLA